MAEHVKHLSDARKQWNTVLKREEQFHRKVL